MRRHGGPRASNSATPRPDDAQEGIDAYRNRAARAKDGDQPPVVKRIARDAALATRALVGELHADEPI
jgi:hypothetical protein